MPSAFGKGQQSRRIEQKLAWLESLSEHLRERKNEDVPAIMCGDFNITPKPIDSHHHWENTKERKDRPGFREDERSRISFLLEGGGSIWSATRIQTRDYSVGGRHGGISTRTTKVCDWTSCWEMRRWSAGFSLVGSTEATTRSAAEPAIRITLR